MVVGRTCKALASVAASVVVSGLLLLADPAQASADSRWDGGGPTCVAADSTTATAADPAGYTDESPWD